jgi:nucleoside-diphosphate-sugar epimerase
MAETEQSGMLVLGGSSLIGGFLLPKLDPSAFVLSRNAREGDTAHRWRQGDFAAVRDWPADIRADHVFALCPIWLLTPELLQGLHARGMRRLVAFSSTSRFTKTASGSAKERAIAAALIEGEAAVEAFCTAHDVGYTLLRPTLIYAEGQDGNVSRLAALIRRLGVMPLPGRAAGLRQPVHADDLAALALAAMDRAPANRAYEVPGGETLTYRAMVGRIFEGLGRRPLILTLPPTLLRLAYSLAKPVLPGSTEEMILRVNDDLVFDAADARRDLGWAPRAFHPRF